MHLHASNGLWVAGVVVAAVVIVIIIVVVASTSALKFTGTDGGYNYTDGD